MIATTSSRAAAENGFSVARRTVFDTMNLVRMGARSAPGVRLPTGPRPSGQAASRPRPRTTWRDAPRRFEALTFRVHASKFPLPSRTRDVVRASAANKEFAHGFRGPPATVREGCARAGHESRNVRLPLREAPQHLH